VRAGRPPVAERARRWQATRGAMLATWILIGINVAVFIYTAAGGRSVDLRSAVTGPEARLGLNRAVIDSGEWWRLITSGFLHFGIWHIASNMYALFILGRLLEPAIGSLRFTGLYFASLLAGSAGALIIDQGGLSGGASGAVFGLMAAACVGLRQRGISLLQSGLGVMLLFNLIITFTIPFISKGGHLGGAIGGAICGIPLLAPQRHHQPKWMGIAAVVAVAAASVVISFAVSSGAAQECLQGLPRGLPAEVIRSLCGG
jgi:membrane associated rhomboid family serine protease